MSPCDNSSEATKLLRSVQRPTPKATIPNGSNSEVTGMNLGLCSPAPRVRTQNLNEPCQTATWRSLVEKIPLRTLRRQGEQNRAQIRKNLAAQSYAKITLSLDCCSPVLKGRIQTLDEPDQKVILTILDGLRFSKIQTNQDEQNPSLKVPNQDGHRSSKTEMNRSARNLGQTTQNLCE
jgi:hypothetical protein